MCGYQLVKPFFVGARVRVFGIDTASFFHKLQRLIKEMLLDEGICLLQELPDMGCLFRFV
jgi:hypothetical protein